MSPGICAPASTADRCPRPSCTVTEAASQTIGRKSAVVDLGRIKLWGAPAWWLWGLVHVGLLVGVRNRISTMVNCCSGRT